MTQRMQKWARERNIALACGHTLEFPSTSLPLAGEPLWCHRCRRMQAQESDCYIATCQQCRYSRNFGAALITAQVRAGAHARRKPGHVVHLIRGRAIISRHGSPKTDNPNAPQQLTLDDLEPPPF